MPEIDYVYKPRRNKNGFVLRLMGLSVINIILQWHAVAVAGDVCTTFFRLVAFVGSVCWEVDVKEAEVA